VIAGSRSTTRLLLAGVPASLVALKFILHVHFSLFGAGFYIGFIVAAALVAFAEMARRNEHHAASPSL
jgi:type IV secretory pathway VirB3-like protein